MSKLDPESLSVSTFETESIASVPAQPDTQQLDCWSPLCVPTEGRTCNCQAA